MITAPSAAERSSSEKRVQAVGGEAAEGTLMVSRSSTGPCGLGHLEQRGLPTGQQGKAQQPGPVPPAQPGPVPPAQPEQGSGVHRGSPSQGPAGTRAQLKGPMARPGCGELQAGPAGALLGRGLTWGAGPRAGTAMPGSALEALEHRQNASSPAPWASQGCRGREHRGRAQPGREELRDASREYEEG